MASLSLLVPEFIATTVGGKYINVRPYSARKGDEWPAFPNEAGEGSPHDRSRLASVWLLANLVLSVTASAATGPAFAPDGSFIPPRGGVGVADRPGPLGRVHVRLLREQELQERLA